MICIHVDDLLGAGNHNSSKYQAAERSLRETFNFRTWDDDSKTLEYCGVHLQRDQHTWLVNQADFIKKIKPVTIHRGKITAK